MRGLGMGSALLNRALDFCRQQGDAHVFLGTVRARDAARARSNRAGLQITQTSANDTWGTPVLEEKWEMAL